MSEDQSESVPLFRRTSKGTKAQRMAREALGRNLLVLTSETWVTEALREAVHLNFGAAGGEYVLPSQQACCETERASLI